jgi:hypothetical protein
VKHLDEAIHESLERLVPPQREQAEWEDVLDRLQHPAVQTLKTKPRRASTWRKRLVPTVALVAAVALLPLLATAPWHGGPSVIEKASAAITAPSPAEVIYERAAIQPLIARWNSRCGQCPKLPDRQRAPVAQIQIWVEGGTGTRNFRATTRQPLPKGFPHRIQIPAEPFGNALARHSGPVIVTEVGGLLGPTHVKEAFVYQRYSNILIRFTQAPTAINSDSFDPVALVRHALASGHARATGTTTINGRQLRIIQVQLRDEDGHEGSATYYVDHNTYAPVQIVYHHTDRLRFPYTPLFDRTPTSIAVHFSAFHRTAATSATRALSNIRTQHKTAKIVCGQEFGLPDC